MPKKINYISWDNEQLEIDFDTWIDEDIRSHPEYDRTLKQLYAERKKIVAFNKKVSSPDYPFKQDIKPSGTKGIDRIINLKLKDKND